MPALRTVKFRRIGGARRIVRTMKRNDGTARFLRRKRAVPCFRSWTAGFGSPAVRRSGRHGRRNVGFLYRVSKSKADGLGKFVAVSPDRRATGCGVVPMPVPCRPGSCMYPIYRRCAREPRMRRRRGFPVCANECPNASELPAKRREAGLSNAPVANFAVSGLLLCFVRHSCELCEAMEGTIDDRVPGGMRGRKSK